MQRRVSGQCLPVTLARMRLPVKSLTLRKSNRLLGNLDLQCRMSHQRSKHQPPSLLSSTALHAFLIYISQLDEPILNQLSHIVWQNLICKLPNGMLVPVALPVGSIIRQFPKDNRPHAFPAKQKHFTYGVRTVLH